MKALCERHGVTRAGFYAWAARHPSRHTRGDERLSTRIRKVFAASDGTYGSPRIPSLPNGTPTTSSTRARRCCCHGSSRSALRTTRIDTSLTITVGSHTWIATDDVSYGFFDLGAGNLPYLMFDADGDFLGLDYLALNGDGHLFFIFTLSELGEGIAPGSFCSGRDFAPAGVCRVFEVPGVRARESARVYLTARTATRCPRVGTSV